MKKLFIVLTVVLILMLFLAGCGGMPEYSSYATSKQETCSTTQESTTLKQDSSTTKQNSTTSEQTTTTEPYNGGFHFQYGIDSDGNGGVGFGIGGFNVVSW